MSHRNAIPAVGAFALALGVAVTVATLGTGHLIYPRDDPYIHLTMARNLVRNGTYGMVPGSFESASSSPAWVVLLSALIRIGPGIAVWYPLLLNFFFGAALLTVLVRRTPLAQLKLASFPSLTALVIIPIALGLPVVAYTGMEHLLQSLICLLIVILVLRAWDHRRARELPVLAALWVLGVAVRYETLFLAAGVCFALLAIPGRPLRQRWRSALLWTSALAPAVSAALLGAINLTHGQYFFDNSIAAKSGAAGIGAALVPHLGRLLTNLGADPLLLGLLAVAALYLFRFRLRAGNSALWVIWTVTTLLHATYAAMGQLDRYQTYLIVLGGFALLRSIPEMSFLWYANRARLLAYTALFLLLPLHKYMTLATLPEQSYSEYSQQIQQARVLQAYDGSAVVVNDIGAVGWLHQGPLLDIWGLGSNQVLRLAAAGKYDGSHLQQLAAEKHAHVAAIYAVLMPLFPDWVPVAEITTPYMPDSDHAVVFLVPGDADEGRLVAALERAKPGFPNTTRLQWLTWGGGNAHTA